MIWVIRKKGTEGYLQDDCSFGDLQTAYQYQSENEAVGDLQAEEQVVPVKLIVPSLRMTANVRPRNFGKMLCDFCQQPATYHWGGPTQGCLCDSCKEKVNA